MYVHREIKGPKPQFYAELAGQLDELLAGETDQLANLCNAAALFGCHLPEINWVGFYLHRDGELRLGPFWGRPACTRIPIGGGVCGTAAAGRETVVVPDVTAFPGHIACDSASRSEIVVPIIDAGGNLFGVLDVDSPVLARFDEDDASGLGECVRVIRRRVADLGS